MQFKDIPKSGFIRGFDGKNKKYVNGGLIRYDKLCNVKLIDGTIIKVTQDHLFLTTDGWCEAIQLKGKILCNIELYQMIYKDLMELNTTREQMDISIKHLGLLKRMRNINLGKVFIEQYGNTTMAQYLSDMLFITKMKIKQITTSKIFKQWNQQNIESNIVKNGTMKIEKSQSKIFLSVKKKLKNGISQIREENGISNIIKICQNLFIKKNCLNVKYAKKNTREQLVDMETNTAQRIVKQRREEIAELITKKEYAHIVQKNLLLISTQEQKHVQEVVHVELENFSSATYCVSVINDGCFSLSNGAIVSNCGYVIGRKYPIVVGHSTAKLMGI